MYNQQGIKPPSSRGSIEETTDTPPPQALPPIPQRPQTQ